MSNVDLSGVTTSEVSIQPGNEKDVVVATPEATPATPDITSVKLPVIPESPAEAAAAEAAAAEATPAAAPAAEATPAAAAAPVATAPAKVDISGALDVLIKNVQSDLSGSPLSNNALVRLVPRFAAALHLLKASQEDKKAVILAAAHKLVDSCAPEENRHLFHEYVDAVVPAVVDATLDVVKGDVVFPKKNWFLQCLMCSQVSCKK